MESRKIIHVANHFRFQASHPPQVEGWGYTLCIGMRSVAIRVVFGLETVVLRLKILTAARVGCPRA